MAEFKIPSEVRIYIPEAPQSRSVSVPHITLSNEEAALQGWHYRRKSRNRLRITRYTGEQTAMTVPAQIGGCIVNEIGAQILSQNETVSQVFVPDTVKKMMPGCFRENRKPGAHHLNQIVFADGLTELPDHAFASCACLSEVHLPKTLSKIGAYAFDSCSALKFIDIPVMCTQIGEYAFCSTGLLGFRINQYISPYLRISSGKPIFSIDGTAFFHSALEHQNDIIALPSMQAHCIDILNVCGTGLKLPNVKVRFCDRSIHTYSSLDMTDCRDVLLSRASFEEQRERYHVSCTLLFPPVRGEFDLPGYVNSNYNVLNLYHSWNSKKGQIHAEPECAAVNEYAVNEYNLEEMYFHRIRAYTNRPTEVFHPHCTVLKRVVWEEEGRTIEKYIPGNGIVRYWVHGELLKAFTVTNDPATGKSSFFDRSVIDKMLRNIPDAGLDLFGRRKKCLNKREQFAIAVDMLRSTPKPEEESLELYHSYLRTNRRIAEYIAKKLPPEYAEYLRSYYQTHPQ